MSIDSCNIDVGNCDCDRVICSLQNRLVQYQWAINRLDDLFEYNYDSLADRSKVYDVLDELCKRLGDEK